MSLRLHGQPWLVAFLMFASLESSLAQQAPQTDFSGVWMVSGVGRGHPMSQWVMTELPFTPAGREVFDNNIPGKGPRQTPPALGNDPIGQANPPGLYRTLIYPRPFEFVQTANKLVQTFEWGKHWRTIWTDGRAVAGEMVSGPYWYGYSVGHWEGDTLVVTTNNLDGRQWIDEWGTPISEFDAVIEERWRRVDSQHMELTITVKDAELYAQPWTSVTISYSLQGADSNASEPLEQIFAPVDEMLFNATVRDPSANVAPKP